MGNILVVEDNETIREGLVYVISKMGHTVYAAKNGEEGLASYIKYRIDFVISDLKMDKMDGLTLLKKIKEITPEAIVMIITAFGTIEVAVDAMKRGAYDFITKPFSNDLLKIKVDKALELIRLKDSQSRLITENAFLKSEIGYRFDFSEIIGESSGIKDILRIVGKVSPTDSTVLITGESGTGKELIAKALHFNHPGRKESPFIKVNCGALPETLLESELFGHEKGAFTGAIKTRLGRFELADKGTIFLDEIGDISPTIQLKLLRVLQEREFERVGGDKTIKVDVRLISATNKNLDELVSQGKFREDLFYRLHIIPIKVPALRERTSDIPVLVNYFLQKLQKKTGQLRLKDISEEAMAAFVQYSWPGNVRELENALEQSIIFAEGETLTLEALPDFIKCPTKENMLAIPSGNKPLPEILEDLERQLILKAYQKAKGTKTETARMLGIKTSALYYKLEKYGIIEKGETTQEDSI